LPKNAFNYRLAIIDFARLIKTSLISKTIKCLAEVFERAGYQVETCLKMLILQFMEDLSDRELARFIAENNAAKLFCDFSLMDKTPDHSFQITAFWKIKTWKIKKKHPD